MRRKVRVVAAGVFDGLHRGHHFYLRAAKRLGDHLTVIVARDATVPIVKKKHAKRSERSRLATVARLPAVDRAVLGDRVGSRNPTARFQKLVWLQPDVVCLGYDQPVDTRKLRRFLDVHGLPRTRIVRTRKAPGT